MRGKGTAFRLKQHAFCFVLLEFFLLAGGVSVQASEKVLGFFPPQGEGTTLGGSSSYSSSSSSSRGGGGAAQARGMNGSSSRSTAVAVGGRGGQIIKYTLPGSQLPSRSNSSSRPWGALERDVGRDLRGEGGFVLLLLLLLQARHLGLHLLLVRNRPLHKRRRPSSSSSLPPSLLTSPTGGGGRTRDDGRFEGAFLRRGLGNALRLSFSLELSLVVEAIDAGGGGGFAAAAAGGGLAALGDGGTRDVVWLAGDLGGQCLFLLFLRFFELGRAGLGIEIETFEALGGAGEGVLFFIRCTARRLLPGSFCRRDELRAKGAIGRFLLHAALPTFLHRLGLLVQTCARLSGGDGKGGGGSCCLLVGGRHLLLLLVLLRRGGGRGLGCLGLGGSSGGSGCRGCLGTGHAGHGRCGVLWRVSVCRGGEGGGMR